MTSGRWAGSDRRDRLPPSWPRLRRRVLILAGHRCEALLSSGARCDAPATDVDHVHRGDDHSLSNLQALCGWHHARKSAAEGGEASSSRRPPRARPAGPHPGVVRRPEEP